LALNFALDIRVVAYAIAVSVGAGILFGLSPALQLTKRDLATALKDEGASLGNLRGSRLRSLLVAAQVAASMFLLAGAGLLTRGVVRSLAADPGFETLTREPTIKTASRPGGLSLFLRRPMPIRRSNFPMT
jgi:hypothetical protein